MEIVKEGTLFSPSKPAVKPDAVYMGYTREELNAAFERVQNEKHWKDRINKVITIEDESEMRLINAAVIFFAGCGADFEKLREPNKYRVTAVGYWEAVGA